jgi:hypothetical protein
MSATEHDVQELARRCASLESVRDEHQRQLLALGELIGSMQDSVLSLVGTVGTQQRTISMLITEYERNIGDIANLPEQPSPANDELAAKRTER